MFSYFFLSKNQKRVKKWTKEHELMVTLAHKTLAEYSKNHPIAAKKLLIKFSNLTLDHLADENIEFFKLLRDEEHLSTHSKKYTEEFIDSFRETRLTVVEFLTKYTHKDTKLDKEFFDTFSQIADVLVERIEFEEDNLYAVLYDDRHAEKLWEKSKRNF